jgi:hypothetical protein
VSPLVGAAAVRPSVRVPPGAVRDISLSIAIEEVGPRLCISLLNFKKKPLKFKYPVETPLAGGGRGRDRAGRGAEPHARGCGPAFSILSTLV